MKTSDTYLSRIPFATSTTRDAILGFILAFIVGGFIGLVQAETIAFSLLEISLSTVFAIVFGIGFCILGIVLAWRIWATIEDAIQKYVMWVFCCTCTC